MSGRRLESPYVGNEFANLLRFHTLLETGHVLASGFDPLAQAGVGHLLPVRKRESRIQAFESRPDFLSCGVREVTGGALPVKELSARNHLLNCGSGSGWSCAQVFPQTLSRVGNCG